MFKAGRLNQKVIGVTLVLLVVLSFSANTFAAKKGKSVSNPQCVNLASMCLLASDSVVRDSMNLVGCCSKSLGYCIVIPKDRSKSCQKFVYFGRSPIQRLRRANKATLRNSIGKRRRRPSSTKGTRMRRR